ncbi:MAG: RimK family alpha-L-glutamate ligase [Thermodesulfobacteriota bacterium]|nr:RimK family alpha-L-glutamate ligase [Thermodesulfobacteriota bacterium]
MKEKRISLGFRPRGCRYVRILGLKPNLDDYDGESRALIRQAKRILYPTPFFAQTLTDAGKRVFPSARHYYYHGDKLRQTTLFSLLNLPHPRTRFFFGRRVKDVGRYFSFPFIAKIPRGLGQGRGVFLIQNEEDWRAYLTRTRVAYVQERLLLERDLRVVIMAGRLVAAYWRIVPEHGFRSNLAQGGRIDLSGVPEDGVAFAMDAVRRCGFDDVGLDVCRYRGQWLVIEANMHYGTKGLTKAGVSLAQVLDQLIEEGLI